MRLHTPRTDSRMLRGLGPSKRMQLFNEVILRQGPLSPVFVYKAVNNTDTMHVFRVIAVLLYMQSVLIMIP